MSKTPLLSNQLYDAMKFGVTTVLPALGTFYYALSAIWGIPYGEEVVGTLSALALLFGAILRISTKTYNESNASSQGVIVVQESEDRDVYSLELSGPVEDLKSMDTVTFKVARSSDSQGL